MGKTLIGRSDMTEFKLDVSRGVLPGIELIDKYGALFNVPTSATIEDPIPIWEYANSQNSPHAYTYLPFNGEADPINSIVTDSAANIGIDIEIQGLNFEGNMTSEIATLNGISPVALANNYWRIFRMQNENYNIITGFGQSIADGSMVYCYQGSSSVTSGKPDDDDKIKAMISNGNNQTKMCIYTIPKGYEGYLMKGRAGVTRSGNQAVNADLCYRSRRFGGVMKNKFDFSANNEGSSSFLDERSVYDFIPELTDIEICCSGISQSGAGIWGSFDILLIDKELQPNWTL